MFGNPHSAVRSATDSVTGIGVNSVATGNWTVFGSATANDANGTSGNSKFPSTVALKYFFTYSAVRTSANPNIQITGLNPAKTYQIEIFGARSASGVADPNRYGDYICIDNNGEETIADYDAKGNVSETVRTSSNTGGGIATFTGKVPTSGGTINLVVNPRDPADGVNLYGYINGMIITEF